ncbi:Peptidase S8/S53 subtilisin/kexin/sedolisin [Neofusicoccum parvum]|nr:Peptidase S8/S53 subtilisin/kexin/sedolisin [Neofusicoccum parvum]
MKSTTLLTLLSAALAAAAPSPHLRRRDTKEYDVLASPSADVAALLSRLGLSPANDGVFATFDNARFRGFSGAITEDEAAALRAADGVLSVEEAVEMAPQASRSDAPWGLQRISSEGAVAVQGSVTARNYTYTWDDASTLGEGVDIYVMDSGIFLEHEEFAGRATMGFNFYDDAPGDRYGHGSHCAGTAGGETVGVATNANLIAVKVIADAGGGTSSGYLAGLDYILTTHAARSTQPDFVASVVSMSLSFSTVLAAIDNSTRELPAAGIHLAIAAGNTYDDACTYSPTSAGGPGTPIVVVGASTAADAILWFSSSGPCVDVYAPGADVVSAGLAGPAAYVADSGTSMAAPHVAGLLAVFVGDDGALDSPEKAKAKVVESARAGALAESANFVEGGEVLLVGNGAY